MKRISWFILLAIFGFLVINSDCTKEPEYLEKYLGTWSFETSWSGKELHIPATGDTSYYKGEIIYVSCKSCITIVQNKMTFKVEPIASKL
jgi:hypothetical protein